MLTFLCKSSRGLVSQKPVLAMLTGADRVPVSGLCSYLTTGCRRRPGAERAAMLPGQRLIKTGGTR